MLCEVKPLTNYCKIKSLDLRGKQRKLLIEKMSQFQIKNNLKLQTLFTAISIANHYLSRIAYKKQKAPSSELMVATCILLATKVVEDQKTNEVVRNLDISGDQRLNEIRALEFTILTELEFDVIKPTPLDFLV